MQELHRRLRSVSSDVVRALIVIHFLLVACFPSSGAAIESTGSGFFISSDGLIVTCHHVVQDAASITVITAGGEILDASVLAADPANDLAVLKVKSVKPTLSLSLRFSASVEKGESVLAFGIPLPGLQGSEVKVTNGIVSSFSGFQGDQRHFQVSNAVQPGNSGGPLLARDGTVIGVVNARLDTLRADRGILPSAQNVSYVVKSDYLLGLISQYVSQSKVKFALSAGRTLSSAEAVRKAEPAIVLVTTKRRESSTSKTDVSVAPKKCPERTEAAESGALVAGVQFWRSQKGVEVWLTPSKSNSLSSSLLDGDLIVECLLPPKFQICGIEDVRRCVEPSSEGNKLRRRLSLKVVRSGLFLDAITEFLE